MFQTAYALEKEQQHPRKCLSSNVKIIDDLIGGGFEAGLSYLFYGSPKCTELLQRAIAKALFQVVPNGGVIVVDGNNGIRPNTILDYIKAIPPPHPTAMYLHHLYVARAFTTDQLLSLLNDVPDLVQERQAPILFVTGLIHLLQEEEEAGSPPPLQSDAPHNPLVFRRAQYAAHLKQLAFTQQIAVVASADGNKRTNQPPLRIGQAAHHRFHVLIRHQYQQGIHTFTLEKHPSRPWQQRITSRTTSPISDLYSKPFVTSSQTTLFDEAP